MKRLGQLLLASALAWLPSASASAEIVDRTFTSIASASVTSTVSMTVQPKLITTNGNTAGIAFGTVSGGGTPWKVAPQYLEITHASNFSNWAIRFYSDNRTIKPTTAGAVLGDNTTVCSSGEVGPDCTDDPLSYGGLIGSTPQDPNNRATMAWQAYQNIVAGGPAAPTADDDPVEPDPTPDPGEVGGYFNAPWAYLADKSDCPSTPTAPLVCAGGPTATNVINLADTDFVRVAQGDAANAFIKLHPETPPRNSDGTIVVYVASRLGSAPADSYSAQLKLDLFHF